MSSQPKATIRLDIIVSYTQVHTHFLSQPKATIHLDTSFHTRQPRLLYNVKLLIIPNVALFGETDAEGLPRSTPFTRSCNQFLHRNSTWWSLPFSALFWCNTCPFRPKVIASINHTLWRSTKNIYFSTRVVVATTMKCPSQNLWSVQYFHPSWLKLPYMLPQESDVFVFHSPLTYDSWLARLQTDGTTALCATKDPVRRLISQLMQWDISLNLEEIE